jgi:hypothetical protein
LAWPAQGQVDSGDYWECGLLDYSRSFHVFGRLVRDWWREPVDYAAQVQYFTKRSLADAIQVMIGVGTGLVGVISLAIQFPSAGPDTLASHVVVAMFAVLTISWAKSVDRVHRLLRHRDRRGGSA